MAADMPLLIKANLLLIKGLNRSKYLLPNRTYRP